MARDNTTYESVMASPLMTQTLKEIYYVLWYPMLDNQLVAGLTKAEIAKNCEAVGYRRSHSEPWEKAVATLSKMGLVQKGNKRHCTVKNKEDVIWSLTDLATPIRPKANKPSAKQYLKAVAQFETLIVHHTHAADGLITPELHKLYEWVRDKVPTPNNGAQ